VNVAWAVTSCPAMDRDTTSSTNRTVLRLGWIVLPSRRGAAPLAFLLAACYPVARGSYPGRHGPREALSPMHRETLMPELPAGTVRLSVTNREHSPQVRQQHPEASRVASGSRSFPLRRWLCQ